MRTVCAWQETPPERDGVANVCYDIAFKPDGTQLVAGIGNRVLVYDAADGDLLHALKGHKDSVYCVAYAHNGKRFASGGADCTVIIWTSKAEGILKYTHNDSIQALSYNPVTQQLASVTGADVGLWSPEQKSVAKHKVSSRILTCCWTADGNYLAVGHFDGTVCIRDKAGVEKLRIDVSGSPVWTICWNPAEANVLACGCLDGQLKFYLVTGQQKSKDRELASDPLCVTYFSNGEYLAISGTDKNVALYTRDGVFLTKIAERENWVWCVRPRPKNNFVAIGCDDGTLATYQLIFSTVHGLYADRYAYRDQMTDVIIQHLITEQKVRIKCKDYVKKIAVYKDKLAVQLPSKIVIYELANGLDDYDMHYQSATKINQKLECNLLVVTSSHVILCQERKLQLYGFSGIKEREWVLDSVIRYIKVVGGPSDREGLLVGLKSGMIHKIFVDNPFPIQLIKHTCSVRCLDLSASRNKLAVVDENANVLVYDLITKEKTFEEKNANSVAWNSEFEDMFCYSGNGTLSIKTGDFPLHQQKLQGFVVGFKGSKIFCLHFVSMQTIDVPQSASMYRYLEKRDFEKAYKVACLGVTEADWKQLALEALGSMQLEVARKSFIRIRDVRYVELVNKTETGKKQGLPEGLLMAEIMAYQGRYQDAARYYTQAGSVDKAMEMFSDLRQFDEAKKWADEYAKTRGESSQVQELINKQAEWSEEVKNYDAAADMYIKAKKYDRAIAILARSGWWDKLIHVVRALDKSDTRCLSMCAAHFKRAGGQYQHAKETLLKMDDTKALIALYVEESKWDDAFLLLHAHPECKADVFLPYAKFLIANDRYDEARVAYKQGGHPDLATRILEQLTFNAVSENRFADASHCFYQLAMEALREIKSPPSAMTIEDQTLLGRFSELYDKAEIYYAYELIHTAVYSPFKTTHPSTLFNVSRFLLMRTLNREAPTGVSISNIVYVLAKHSMDLSAFKLARFACNKLQTLLLPPEWQSEVDMKSIIVRSKPFSDAEELLPVCYRCSTVNPMLNTQGDFCINCGAPFIRSFVTFEHLPLIEFELDDGISDQDATRLLGEDAGVSEIRNAGKSNPSQGGSKGSNVLRLDEGDMIHNINDSFAAQQMVPNATIKVDKATLRNLKTAEVIVRPWPNPCIPNQYFRITDNEVPLMVGPCGHFFEQDEYEMACLEKGFAPFSRETLKAEGLVASHEDEDEDKPKPMGLGYGMLPTAATAAPPKQWQGLGTQQQAAAVAAPTSAGAGFGRRSRPAPI